MRRRENRSKTGKDSSAMDEEFDSEDDLAQSRYDDDEKR